MADDYNSYITHGGQGFSGSMNDITHCNYDICMAAFNTCPTFGLQFENLHPAMAYNYTLHKKSGASVIQTGAWIIVD